jgi:Zn-dependent protease
MQPLLSLVSLDYTLTMNIESIIFVVILIISIILHEIAHGFAADKLGDPTARLQGRLSLYILIGLVRLSYQHFW